MVQSISKSENLRSGFVNLTPTKSLSAEEENKVRAQFESIIQKFSSDAESIGPKKEEKESTNISEELKKAGSKYSMCTNCGSIFMEEIAICTNCGNTISQDSAGSAPVSNK